MWRRVARAWRTLRVGIGRLRHHRAAHALATWRDVAALAAASPTAALIDRILGSKESRWLRRAWREWDGWARVVAAHRRAGRRALGHLVHRAVAPAFLRWLGAWHAARRRLLVLDRARRAFYGEVGRCWRTWVAACIARRDAVAAARRAVGRWVDKRRLRAWNTWAATAAEMLRAKATLTSALAAFRRDVRRRAPRPSPRTTPATIAQTERRSRRSRRCSR